MPKVSIILSSYNHANYIGESIQSILDQTFEDFELFIIDDCSTDDSWRVIRQYKDPRITTIRNKKNIGVVVRPEIINQLSGEYLAMAHCDDRWEPAKLEKQVKFLDTHPDYAACFTQTKLIDDNGNEFTDESHRMYYIFKQKNRSRLEWLRQFFYHGNVLCHPSVLLRISAQKKYDLYAIGLAALPDEYRWIKICLHDNIYVYPEELTDFRVRSMDENTSGDRLDNILRYNFEIYILLSMCKETLKYSKTDFLMVYPSAKKYFVDGDNDMEYILARALIDMDFYQHKLYGMELLWRIMQDPKRRNFIETKYNFSNKDFVELSGSIDMFNYLASDKTMTSRLYYDTGKGFNEKESIAQEVYINGRGIFWANFDLSRIKNIQNLRFDPFEKRFIKLKNVVITIDGKEVQYNVSEREIKDDGYNIFEDGDPQFVLNGLSGKSVVVKGFAREIAYDEIKSRIESLQQQSQSLQEQLDQTYWRRIKRRIKSLVTFVL